MAKLATAMVRVVGHPSPCDDPWEAALAVRGHGGVGVRGHGEAGVRGRGEALASGSNRQTHIVALTSYSEDRSTTTAKDLKAPVDSQTSVELTVLAVGVNSSALTILEQTCEETAFHQRWLQCLRMRSHS